MAVNHSPPPDSQTTKLVIPVSKETFFNTKWQPTSQPLCPYDMLFHPPDYNPKSARSDRQEPKIIKDNIWKQVPTKTTGHLTHIAALWLWRARWRPTSPRFCLTADFDGTKYHSSSTAYISPLLDACKPPLGAVSHFHGRFFVVPLIGLFLVVPLVCAVMEMFVLSH